MTWIEAILVMSSIAKTEVEKDASIQARIGQAWPKAWPRMWPRRDQQQTSPRGKYDPSWLTHQQEDGADLIQLGSHLAASSSVAAGGVLLLRLFFGSTHLTGREEKKTSKFLPSSFFMNFIEWRNRKRCHL